MNVWDDKYPAIVSFLKEIVPHDPTTGVCSMCGKEVVEEEFVNQVSKREYQLSGMCQACQDGFFESEEE